VFYHNASMLNALAWSSLSEFAGATYPCNLVDCSQHPLGRSVRTCSLNLLGR
jgi:hypothetical protein